VVASAGAVAAAVVGTAVAGATIGTVLSHFMNKSHAEWLQEQIERGGLLLRRLEPHHPSPVLRPYWYAYYTRGTG